MVLLFIVYIQRNQDTRHAICQWIQSFKLIHISTFSYMHKEAYMSSIIDHVYITFVQHIITSFDIYRHADYSTYSYIILHHSCRHVFDLFRHHVYICRICFPWNMKLKHTCIDIIWHYLTSFDTIWWAFLFIFVSVCRMFLIPHGGRSDVEYRSNLSKGACGFIIRLNSTKFAGATIFSRTSGKK